MSKRKNRTHPDEFKKEAVRLALESGKTKAAVARELGICVSLLYGWINQHTTASEKGVSTDPVQAESKKVQDLEAENKRLKAEVAILKKAAAYFAKDQL